MSSKLRMVSWILLSLVGGLTLFAAVASMYVAYFSDDDPMGETVALSELSEQPELAELVTAIRARRGTSAAYGAGYGLLFLIVTLLPYRKGDVWAWWAILVATLVVSGIILLRTPVLDTHLGLGAATIPLAVCVVALLLDVSRLRNA